MAERCINRLCRIQFEAMADTEAGIKWWARYVIVPLLGGGSVIAIIATTVIQYQGSHKDRSQPITTAPASAPIGQPATAPVTGAQPQERKPDPASAPVVFQLFNLKTGQFLPGSSFTFYTGTPYKLHWTIPPDAVNGSLLLRITLPDSHIENSISYEGDQSFGCDIAATLRFELIEMADSKPRQLREIDVTCATLPK